jgi:predicted 3-demethylubiquinone-9 3-methyltransferase (glyoxalase superfamily)
MQQTSKKITPCLWFDDQAEEAVTFYTSIFKNSKVVRVTRYGEEPTPSGKAPGTVLTVAFQINGQEFVALNGGPHFKFTEAISLMVNCDSQDEIDYYWDKLSAGGDETAQQCGWLKDKYGLSWQIVPTALEDLLNNSDAEASQQVWSAIMQMKKLDLAAIQQAAGHATA